MDVLRGRCYQGCVCSLVVDVVVVVGVVGGVVVVVVVVVVVFSLFHIGIALVDFCFHGFVKLLF